MLGSKSMLECEFIKTEVKSNLFPMSLKDTTIKNGIREKRDIG